MNNSLVAIVVTFLAITLTFPLVGSQPTQPLVRGQPFYKLSLQWPNSACKSMPCVNPTLQGFSIHGLWPHSANGYAVPSYFQNPRCTTVTGIVYPQNLIGHLSSIRADLYRYWPNLKGPSQNEDFWKHEWGNHGMCSGYGNQPIGYFSLALSLTRQINLFNILQQQGIVPNNSNHYYPTHIANVIHQKLGVLPEIQCNMDFRSRTVQLVEVRLCFDWMTRRPRNCIKQFSYECSRGPNGQIRFTAP